MKRFTVLAVTLLVLGLGACTSSAPSTSAPTTTTTAPRFDRLILPDGAVALGDRSDPSRFTPMGVGLYQAKAAYAVTALVADGLIVGLVSPASKGGTVDGFTYGSSPGDLGSGFNPATFGGQSAFVHTAPGGWFYAIEAGCPLGRLNLVAFVAEGHKAYVEANVTISPCDPYQAN